MGQGGYLFTLLQPISWQVSRVEIFTVIGILTVIGLAAFGLISLLTQY